MGKQLNDIMKDEKPFNMAVLFLSRLDARLDEANLASIQPDLIKWYRVLRVIYRMVHFKIKEAGHEKKEAVLDQQFNKVKNLIKSITDSDKTARNFNQFAGFTLSDVEEELDKLETHLVDLMNEYKLIMPDLYEKKKDEQVHKFIETYVKKSVIKAALKDKAFLKRNDGPDLPEEPKDPEDSEEPDFNDEEE